VPEYVGTSTDASNMASYTHCIVTATHIEFEIILEDVNEILPIVSHYYGFQMTMVGPTVEVDHDDPKLPDGS